ncbi:MAG: hypothetical protein GY943_28220, partial [Chloroflexi bacterium]|nr:hypothetical protein [Chloroflexota bacterium]
MTERNHLDFTQVEDRVSRALKAWHLPASSADDLLLDFLIAQEALQQSPAADDLTGQRLATNQLLLAGLEQLALQDPELAQVLRLRFVDKQKLWAVANAIAVSPQTVSRLQKKGVQQLAQIIIDRETSKRTHHIQQMEAALPPAPYTKLFGVQDAQQQLLNLLLDPDGPAIIGVIGLGGIGKTSLTDAVTRHIIHQFYFNRVVWLRIDHQTLSGQSDNPELTFEHILTGLATQFWPQASENVPPQQRLAKLQQELNKFPHLIIIDNIESQMDAAYIIDRLHGFAHPTKFLLTSRSRLTEQSTLFNFRLQELTLTDATRFVRHHAHECGIESVAAASDEDVGAIYDLTGGNPLALKLVVSLLDILPLPEILADLTKTHMNSIEGMYRHIYRQSWNTLTDNGRILLQTMPLVSESGGTLAYLATISGLPKEKLWPALHELSHRSL